VLAAKLETITVYSGSAEVDAMLLCCESEKKERGKEESDFVTVNFIKVQNPNPQHFASDASFFAFSHSMDWPLCEEDSIRY